MRVRNVFVAVLAGSTYAAAQPADLPQPEELPPPEVPVAEQAPGADLPPPPPPPAPAPPVTVAAPPGAALPPITINITNNNTGNNSNTNTQTNSQANPQTNNQTNTQTNSVPVTVTTTVAAPGTVAPTPIAIAPRPMPGRYELIKPHHREDNKWLALGFSRSGVRASIDVLGRGPWTIGVAATAGGGEHGHGHGDGGEAGAVAYLAYTTKLGPFDVRASLGLGAGGGGGGEQRGHRGARDRDDDDTIARSTTGGTTTQDPMDRHGGHGHLAMRAEAALLVGLPLTKHLGLLAGPVISTSGDGGERHGGNERHGGEHDVATSIMAGLRYRF